MSMEWDLHNYAYNYLNETLKERAADVSLNNGDKFLYYLIFNYDTIDMY